jgi:phenylalanyl-tRNA synthetase alpha chain
MMRDKISKLQQSIEDLFQSESEADGKSASLVRARLLGRSGLLTAAFADLRNIPQSERASHGQALNQLKRKVEKRLAEFDELVVHQDWKLPSISKCGVSRFGMPNMLQDTMVRLSEFFSSRGFVKIDGPHVDTPKVNFEMLNTPPSHPSRRSTDTFYFDEGTMLRTHTTGTLANGVGHLTPPFKAYALGPVYRNDDEDATHTTMFHQIDVLVVEKRLLSMVDLKGLVDEILCCVVGQEVRWEFVPSYFPFTMPGGEAYIDGLEVLGCGLLHKNVLKAMGRDDCTALAIGMGIERVCALNQQRSINIRELYRLETRRY